MSFHVQLEVLVDMPRGSFVKHRDDGSVDWVWPVPSPFNYGSVPNTRAPDGDREDVIVVGKRLPKGTRRRLPVLARAHFIDAGLFDGKWICGHGHALRVRDRLQIAVFFRLYVPIKRLMNRWRGLPGPTRYAGLELAPRPVWSGR